MKKLALALFSLAVSVGFAQAHALYIIVNGEKVQVIFSDDLKPDAKIKEDTWKKVDPNVRVLRKIRDEEWFEVYQTKKIDSALEVEVISEKKMIVGSTSYGVSKHGDKPKHLTFLYKYVNSVSGDAAAHREKCDLDVIPFVADGKIKFQVKSLGEVLAKSDVEIIVPGKEEKVKVTTDEKGFTKEFDAKGLYGVTAKKTIAKGGEYKGEKFEETGFTATLVTNLK